jgi:release factor glutamine methyltransferase
MPIPLTVWPPGRSDVGPDVGPDMGPDVGTDALLSVATERLAAAGVDSARWDAEQLLAHVTGVPRSRIKLIREIGADEQRMFIDLVDRRATRVPLQHLTGVVGFRYIDVEVGPGVFIPRPETEVVAGLAIDAARRTPGPVIVDLCSGSGVIALAIANEVPEARVYAVEADARAFDWMVRNADARSAAGDRAISAHHGDIRTELPELDATVDVVVSNPPYVAESELAVVDPEVRDHDPRVALVAGANGLAVIREVVAAAERLLAPGGMLVVEHGDGQGESCPALITARGGWVDVVDRLDLAGRPRCTTARWLGRG